MRILISVFFIILVSIVLSCCNNKSTDVNPEPEDNDYNQDEPSVLSEGWTKVFNEDFNSDFSKWNVWEGGAYNNEYQYYSKDTANLKIKDGMQLIKAKKETITGATTNSNATPKTFNFTSGRIESITSISATTTTTP